jgi:hypothetical protein
LSFRLDSELLTPRKLRELELTVWARCVSVHVDRGQRQLVHDMEQRKLQLERERLEDWILERRIRRLAAIFEDPRTATLWWFAQNPEHLEQLIDKADLFFSLDRRLNGGAHDAIGAAGGGPEEPVIEPDLLAHDEVPEPDPTVATDGQVLDQFLLDVDPAGQAALGIVLANLYRDHGRHDLADRIQRYAQPPPASGF